MRRAAQVLYLLGVVLPLAAGTAVALRYSLGEFSSGGFTLHHFSSLWDVRFLRSIGFTAAIAVVATLAALWTALGVVRRVGAVEAVPGWLLIPLAWPPVVVAFVVFHAFSGSGLLSRVFHAVGWVDDPAEFVSLVNDRWGIGIAVAHYVLTFPALVLFLLYLRSRPTMDDLDRVAQSLGALQRERWRSVVRPVIVRQALPLVLVYAIFTLGSYEVAKLLGAQRIQAVVPFLSDRISGYNLADIPAGYALALGYTVLIAVAMAVISKRFGHG